jgi:hypothetical protein
MADILRMRLVDAKLPCFSLGLHTITENTDLHRRPAAVIAHANQVKNKVSHVPGIGDELATALHTYKGKVLYVLIHLRKI